MTDDVLHWDSETRSTLDLRVVGVDRYAEHVSTKALCAAWGFNHEPVQPWRAWAGEPFPARVAQHIRAGGRVVIHNAAFDRVIHNVVIRRDWPDVPEMAITQTDCTMVRALALGLPGGLDALCKALRLPITKDIEGYKLMLRLCKPIRSGGELCWDNDPVKLERLALYCVRDVEAERPLDDVLPALTPEELELWHLSERINQRGIKVDLINVQRAAALVELEARALSQAVSKLTKGVAATQRQELLKWLNANGLTLPDMKKHTVRDALKGDLPNADIRQVLDLQGEANKTSTAKLKKMLQRACSDGRARGEYRFNGASTGRFSGSGIQLQNLTRPDGKFKLADAENIYEWLAYPCARSAIRLEYGSPMLAVSNSIRPLLIADEGHEFICADYSNIEGRVLAWLAGEEWKLNAFRDYDTIVPGKFDAKGKQLRAGPDLYVLAFANSFGVSVDGVDDDQRQLGKVQELALGFAGGVGAFLSMAANYDADLEQIAAVVRAQATSAEWAKAQEQYSDKGTNKYELPEHQWCAIRLLVNKWRAANSEIRSFWYDLENAAVEAVRQPSKVTSVNGKLHFKVADNFLWMRLPSGRKLAYAYPELRQIETPWGVSKASVRVHGTDKGGFFPFTLYSGILAENPTQAIARDLLTDAMKRLELKGYPIVMHTHDECAAEVPVGHGSLDEYCTIMCELPKWAMGIPVSVAGWRGRRYRKA